MTTQSIETERKYEADPQTAVPELTGLPGVAAESGQEEFLLEAEYYDTEDLRLLRAGITLRRRRGGADAGWHLKLPAGRDSRIELRRPLGRNRVVPAELARLVRVHARGAALRPVARIETMRRQRVLVGDAGESLAEVADDLVSAQSLGTGSPGTETELSRWREVEVELTGGGRRLLDAADRALRDAGLRPPGHSAKLERVLGGRLSPPAAPATPGGKAAAGDVVLAYLAEHVAALKSADPRVRRDEPDAVHQMRVSTRRLRSTLSTFSPVLRRADTEQLRAELKWLGEVLGAARDGEVLTEHVQGLLAEVPAELVIGPARATVTERLAPRHAAAVRAAQRALDSPRYFALLDSLDELIAGPPLTEAAADPAKALRAPVVTSYRRLRRRMAAASAAAGSPGQDAALHEARKAAKRARYAADALVPAAGKPAARFAKRMKQLQTILGDHHDTVVARGAIRELGITAGLAGDSSFTFGLLHATDACRAERLREQADRSWQRASRKKYRRWLG